LAETIVIYGIGIYGIFGREIIKYTVTYGAYIQFWPTLSIFSPVCVTSPVCEPCSAPLLPGHCQEYILYTPIARALSGVHFVHPYCPGTVRSTFCTQECRIFHPYAGSGQPEPYACTVYKCMCGHFPANNTTYVKRLCVHVLF